MNEDNFSHRQLYDAIKSLESKQDSLSNRIADIQTDVAKLKEADEHYKQSLDRFYAESYGPLQVRVESVQDQLTKANNQLAMINAKLSVLPTYAAIQDTNEKIRDIENKVSMKKVAGISAGSGGLIAIVVEVLQFLL